MAKPIRCPACGVMGLPSDGEVFEVRGQFKGKAVRKCIRCGTGLYVRPFHKAQVIQHDLWVRMQQSWDAEFGPSEPAIQDKTESTKEPTKAEPTDLEIIQLLFRSAENADSVKARQYQVGGTVRLMTYFCVSDGLNPNGAAGATYQSLLNFGLPEETAFDIMKTLGIPMTEEEIAEHYGLYRFTEGGWADLSQIIRAEWAEAIGSGVPTLDAFRPIWRKLEELFPLGEIVMACRLAGLPGDEIADALNKAVAEAVAEKGAQSVECRCGCGEVVLPPNKAYVNKEHRHQRKAS